MQTDQDLELFKAQLQVELENLQATIQRDLELLREIWTRDRKAWEHHLDWRIASFRAIVQFAIASIPSLVLVNGGAVVEILAFLGSVWHSNEDAAALPIMGAIARPLTYFVVGLAAGIATALLAYLRSGSRNL